MSMEPTRTVGTSHLLRLDHLRFLAVFMVAVYHFLHYAGIPYTYVPDNAFSGILEEGHTGVAIFIVISGFVFEYICFDKEIIYSRFILNRVLRIFPLLILFSLYAAYTTANVRIEDVVFNLLTLSNPKGMVSVGWTIAVEFQFYFIFPFLHAFLKQKGPDIFSPWLCSLFLY